MKLIVVAMGKLKRSYFREAERDYVERIRKFIPFEIVELKKESLDSRRKDDFWERWKRQFGKESLPILLDESGKQFSTLEFARFIEENIGKLNLIFFIGGPFGFPSEVSLPSLVKISLSKMTLNHQIARILLLEQIYRSFKIIRGEPYHH
jgi:23S rRNA (pseudouridine1915-N3)-methyltransferase